MEDGCSPFWLAAGVVGKKWECVAGRPPWLLTQTHSRRSILSDDMK